MASIVRNVTFFLLLFLSLVTALPAGASSERNSILSGVKAESASCFVRGDVMPAQMRRVPVGRTATGVLTLSPFGERGQSALRSVVVTGRIVRKSPDYVVRIVLKDSRGGERLVLESMEETAPVGADTLTFTGYGEETLLMDGMYADSLKVFASDATVMLDEVSYTTEPVMGGLTPAANRKRQVESIVERINAYNVANGKLWRAAVTEVSLLDYATKKRVVGIADGASSLGIEYYGGGIFELGSHADMARSRSAGRKLRDATPSPYIDHFDWRNRHGQNWITSVKNQTSYDCTYYMAAGLAEAMINLYYNQHVDMDLSEQYISDNSTQILGIGNTFENVLDALKNPGAISSYSIDTIVRISDYTNMGICDSVGIYVFTESLEDQIKRSIIENGPLASGYQWVSNNGYGGHAMILIGYGEIHEGDTIRIFDHNTIFNDTITIPTGDGRIGKTYWIFKNSWGTNSPYMLIRFEQVINMSGPYIVHGPITVKNTLNQDLLSVVCEDRDGDGYYNWGIGPKPNNEQLRGVWPEPDGDDTDSTRGPMDEYGYCESTDPDTKDTIFITSMVTDTLTKHIYQHVVVTYGGTWCPGPRIFHNGAKLFIRDGGRVSCGYTMENLDLHMDSGGTFSVDESWEETTGKVIPVSGKGFSVPPGGRFELNKGKITNH